MNNNFLTIYEVADVLGLHHKTVRGFIASGKLKATKVGKLWRITKEDLDVFMGRDTSLDKKDDAEAAHIDLSNREIQYANNKVTESQIKNRISISAVVDIQSVYKNKFERISNTLLAVMNSKDVKMVSATMHIKYDEAAMVCKVFLWGSIEYVNEMLSIIKLLDKEDSDEVKS
jgi:DNA binding domain, excisionase family